VLKITVDIPEGYDEQKEEFIPEVHVDLELEHSLVAISKWESEFKKPFLAPGDKTTEQAMGYIKAMILTPDYPADILTRLSDENIAQINTYIDEKMTATWFNHQKKHTGPSREQITSELIYYWIVCYQIPWEVQYWHLSRLLTLIEVFNAKNSKEKKVSPSEAAAQRRALNEQRKAQYGTKG
jgi:hypothetical protein